MANESFVSLAASRVRIELRPFDETNKIVICRQCAKAPCVTACPEAAISLREDGAWVIDYGRCNNCMKCIDACPFDAIFWNPLADQVIKCELCDGEPQCVLACATGAVIAQTTVKE
jgi:Fe-S-cluster-containing hydrogenase component 2